MKKAFNVFILIAKLLIKPFFCDFEGSRDFLDKKSFFKKSPFLILKSFEEFLKLFLKVLLEVSLNFLTSLCNLL